jgi:hypothetical protein
MTMARRGIARPPEQETYMKPTLGRIVLYRVSATDAARIEARRAEAIRANIVREGDVYPLLITRVWGEEEGSAFNGTLFLDGPDTQWITSTSIGDGPAECFWPVRE